jgi:hypothetical protein
MEKKSKADIKKLIADLHAKKNGGEAKHQHVEDGATGKGSKGTHVNKTYRPKI